MAAPPDAQSWGIVGSLMLALVAVARFLLRWEKTFSEAARDEIVLLRQELSELRAHVGRCESENEALRRRVSDLERRLN